MNERISRLRQKSLDAIETVSAERAILVTQFYSSKEAVGLSTPVLRAKNFEYLLNRKELFFDPDELIIGERGPAPKATPTYPEVCLHSMEDLDILDTRPKVSFKVSPEVKEIYKNLIIPFWQGKSNRERIMGKMSREWHLAYEAGIFTEFQEQRAPGHTA